MNDHHRLMLFIRTRKGKIFLRGVLATFIRREINDK